MTDFRIDIIVQPAGAVAGITRIERRLGGLERRGLAVGRLLNRTLAFVGVAAGIREIARLADVFTNAQNRIRLVTTSTAQLNAVTDELFQISKKTRVSFEATSTLFARTALATKDLGLSMQETLDFTESLNQAIILSGASAQEANAGIIQLSQGLASGTLRGDELRSVLEQLPKVADVIAEQMGITRGELRLLGEAGRISATQIIDAFANASEQLDKDFASTVPTIAQGFSVLTSSFIQYISEVNEATGISEKFARLLITISENLDLIGDVIGTVAIIIGVHFAKTAIGAAITGVRALTVAIAANPIGALVVGIVAAVAALINFADEITISTDGAATLEDAWVVAWGNVTDSIEMAGEAMEEFAEDSPGLMAGLLDAFGPLGKEFDDLFGDLEFSIAGVATASARVTDIILSTWVGAFRAIVAVFKKLPIAIASVFIDVVNKVIAANEFMINGIIDGINAVSSIANLDPIDAVNFDRLENTFKTGFGDLGEIAGKAFSETSFTIFEDSVAKFLADTEAQAQKRLRQEGRGKGGDLDKKPEKKSIIPFAFKEQVRLLNEEAAALQMSSRERDIQNKLLDIEGKLRTANVDVTSEGFAPLREELVLLLQRNQALKEQAEVLDSVKGPQQELEDRSAALNALLQAETISLGEFNREMERLAFAQAELNISQGEGTFFDGFLLGIEGMLDAVKNFSAEAGAEFASFFESTSEGFADAISNAIVFGESLEEALGNAARQGLQQLISGLIKLGIQYVINAALGETVAASATAVGVAQAATLATAYASAAALASLASFGANAVPAQAGIVSTVALAQGLALALADGGLVSGPGGPRADKIPAMLSNGEFVINAASTARNRPLLEAINNDSAGTGVQAPAGGGQNAGGTGGGESQPSGSTTVVNVLDPSLVGDYLNSSSGERVLINVIERNANSVSQLLGRN